MNLLNHLCVPDAALRRQRLQETLARHFPTRHRVESHRWGPSAPVADTVNHLVVFGREGGHLVLGAHYDAVPGSPGANDNGAALVQLIEAAQAVQAQVEAGHPEANLTFAFWDHEEILHERFRYRGSRLYAETHRHQAPARAVVFDVSGIGDTFFVSGEDHAGLLPQLPTRYTPGSDDITLRACGIPATLVCALPAAELGQSYPDTWLTMHTAADAPADIQPATLRAGAALALSLAQAA